MLDLSRTKEQEEVRERVRAFVDEQILPVAHENDTNRRVDKGIINGAAELGLLGATIPKEYGGLGLDFVSLAIIAEEL